MWIARILLGGNNMNAFDVWEGGCYDIMSTHALPTPEPRSNVTAIPGNFRLLSEVPEEHVVVDFPHKRT